MLPPSETRPKVISNARNALELDPALAQPHVDLGYIDLSQWRWPEAEIEFRRALELNPNDSEAHFGLADWLLCHGRLEEALSWARRGRELDPVGPHAGSHRVGSDQRTSLQRSNSGSPKCAGS